MQGVGSGKFCRGGINCRSRSAILDAEIPHFIGFFTMARGLLIKVGGRAVRRLSEFLPCCLLLAPRRLHWTPSNR